MNRMISIIVAVAENYAIGKENQLLWHIPGDLKRFKSITLGHTIIMGKKTYESLPKRPLPGRINMVLTDDPKEVIKGCQMAYSIEDVMEKCDPFDENFIIGGGSVYRQFLPLANKLYLTRVHKSFEADTFFPEINKEEWECADYEKLPFDSALGFSYSYETYVKKPQGRKRKS